MIKKFIIAVLFAIFSLAPSALYKTENAVAEAAKPSNVAAVNKGSAKYVKVNALNKEGKNVATSKIYANVVHVADGDTITVQTKEREKLKIRFYAIDAPEKAQPYGPQSTGILKNLVLNKYVNIEVVDTDRYGRRVARVYLGKQDINAEMIRLGAAWHYRYYDKSSKYQQYEDLEKYARTNHKGLWNKNNPTPPWEYRKAEREKKKY